MAERVLITGVTGFAGSHLAEFLTSLPGVEIYGTRRWRSDTGHIDHLSDRISIVECDVRDLTSVLGVLRSLRPQKIFHLAAQSHVAISWDAPEEALTTNILGTLHLLEAVRQLEMDPLILVAGSSEEYGIAEPHEFPLKETNALRPMSPYAVSKVGQDLLSLQYVYSYQLGLIRTRAFNVTGPRHSDVFVCSSFARQIAEQELGLAQGPLRVGNLEAIRDFTDVRDIVRAYWLALERGVSGEVYNVCSGKGHRIQEILDRFLAMARVSIKAKVDPDRLRPSDVPRLIGDPGKFKAQTGWEPEIPLDQSLADILQYWRERLASP